MSIWTRIKSFFGKREINAGKTGRLSKNFRPTKKPFNLEIKGKETLILSRAKFLEHNSPQLNSMLLSVDRNVIRNGIKMQSKVKNSKGVLNKKINDDIEQNWEIWTRKEFCDVQGMKNFYQLQKIGYRRCWVDGGVFVKFIYNAVLRYPIQIQLLEVDLLDIDKNEVLPNGNQIVAGVEINKYRKPVAYYLLDTPRSPFHSYLNYKGKSERVSTDNIMLVFNQFRVDQLHPLSRISCIVNKLNDLLDIDENELTKEKLQTALSAIIIKNDAYNISLDESEDTDEDGDTEEIFKSGGVAYLEQGEDIKAFESNKNQSGYAIFNKVQERNASKAVGLSAEQTTGDLSEVNYSSARTGSIEDEKFFKMEQNFMIESFCQPIYEKFIDVLYLMGIIKAIDFTNNPYKYYKSMWLTPGNDWIDPLKQAQAEKLLIDNGLKSRRQYFAEQGKDYDEQMDNIQMEIEDLEFRGLDFLIVDNSEKGVINQDEQREDSENNSRKEQ